MLLVISPFRFNSVVLVNSSIVLLPAQLFFSLPSDSCFPAVPLEWAPASSTFT